MTTGTKIILSDKELELVCNTDWILTKHAVTGKVYGLLGEVSKQFEDLLLADKNFLPVEVFIHSAKISKGENYRQLPYVILDYPRYFTKQDTIAIRTLFWWGNFFSVSLQLSGKFLEESITLLKNKFQLLQQQDFWICISDGPWEHHFEPGNFRPIRTMDKKEFADILLRKPFIKIAKKIPLHNWQEIPIFILETFEELTGLLKFN